MSLLNSQKEQLYEVISKNGFMPVSFDWEVITNKYSHDADRLILKGSEFYFDFLDLRQKWYASYSPGSERVVESDHFDAWIEMLSIGFYTWLHNLKRETNTKDPWEEIKGYQSVIDSSLLESEDSGNYSYEKCEEIALRLRNLETRLIEQFELDDRKSKVVRSRIEYLIDQVKKQSKINWTAIFVGSLITLALDLSFDREQASALWQIAKECFKSIIHLPAP